jgi:hypothetical protein
MSEASARILQILLRCGMIAREEQEIVRGLIRAADRAGLCPGPVGARTSSNPQLR